MNKNIIIAGVGGQGILTVASIIDLAAMHSGLNVKQAEVHGMSQRGGAVESHLRISDSEIYSDLIQLATADIILAVEPMEALRYLPYLSKEGKIITSSEPVKNIANYPDENKLMNEIKKIKNAIFVDAVKIAREIGEVKASNTVLIGVAANFLGIETECLEWGITTVFKNKSQKLIDNNIKAFREGLQSYKI